MMLSNMKFIKINIIILCFIILPFTSYSQSSEELYQKISSSMNIGKWFEINSINIVYENKQKSITDKIEFDEIQTSSIESVISNKNIGSRSEKRFGDELNPIYIINKTNQKYISFTSNINDNKPDITYFDEDEVKIRQNFITTCVDIKYMFAIRMLNEMKDSLNYLKEVDIIGESSKMYVSPTLSNPIFVFYFNKNNKLNGYELISSKSREFYLDFTNKEGLIIPKIIYSVSEKYQNLYTLTNLTLNLNYPNSLFY